MTDSRKDKVQIHFWATAEAKRDLAVLVANLVYERRGCGEPVTQEGVLNEVVTLCSQIPPGNFREVEDFIRGLSLPLAPPADLSTRFQKPPRLGKKRA